jgi:hypothetical protein
LFVSYLHKAMTIPIILDPGVLLMGLLLLASARRRSSRRPLPSELPKGHPPDSLPYKGSLAGVPLRILLSDRSGPGGLLRDTLMTRPSTRDE